MLREERDLCTAPRLLSWAGQANVNQELQEREAANQEEAADEPWLSDLLGSQNVDGGWGFRRNQASAIEPTSWALLALAAMETRALPGAKGAGIRFLKANQLRNGSWPAVPTEKEGSWVTALACLALRQYAGADLPAAAGLDWLSRSTPGEGGAWWSLRNRLFGDAHLATQNNRLRGWSWTQGTSSWVEPTACALLALRGAEGSRSLLARLERRRKLAMKMLCDRACADGGWNCGNPMVYGVAGTPLVGPTCWALLALAEFADESNVRDRIDDGVRWLERAYVRTRGAGSLALGHVCLKVLGRDPQPIGSVLSDFYERAGFLGQIPVLAWASMALRPAPAWLPAIRAHG